MPGADIYSTFDDAFAGAHEDFFRPPINATPYPFEHFGFALVGVDLSGLEWQIQHLFTNRHYGLAACFASATLPCGLVVITTAVFCDDFTCPSN